MVLVINKGVGGSQDATSDNLGDLGGGQRCLEDLGNLDLEGGEGVVKVHDCVDEGVENHKDPDGGRGESDAGPHGEHGAGVVVCLEH